MEAAEILEYAKAIGQVGLTGVLGYAVVKIWAEWKETRKDKDSMSKDVIEVVKENAVNNERLRESVDRNTESNKELVAAMKDQAVVLERINNFIRRERGDS